jgi:hypothetical protein
MTQGKVQSGTLGNNLPGSNKKTGNRAMPLPDQILERIKE